MPFVRQEERYWVEPGRDIGPALWPVALPAWMDVLASSARMRRRRGSTVLTVSIGLHLVAVALLLSSPDVDLQRFEEQSRLTLLRIAAVAEEAAPGARTPDPAQAQPSQAPSEAQPTPIQWTRVRNWRPEASGETADGAGGGGGGDVTALLAGLGASGPAGAADGVSDPYAGASPIWAGRGAKSALLLRDAPNPAVLDEIRSHIALSFPGLRGRAQITVMFDGNGVVTQVIAMDSDLPDGARRKLQDALVGRVIAKAGQRGGAQLKLPEIVFG